MKPPMCVAESSVYYRSTYSSLRSLLHTVSVRAGWSVIHWESQGTTRIILQYVHSTNVVWGPLVQYY